MDFSSSTYESAPPPPRGKGNILFILGATMSSVGKGIVASSMSLLARKTLSDVKSVSIIKVDPYLNCDAGLMSPYEHGEVFVLDDGAEVDLDLGNYERFLDISLTRKNSITTGIVYNAVIQRERAGGYQGKTVQVIPHITDEIERRIREVSDANNLTIVEIGGTIGDIELLPFVHAAAAMRKRYAQWSREDDVAINGPNRAEGGSGDDSDDSDDSGSAAKVLFGLVSYVPCLSVGSSSCSEQKTKPTQHAVAQLRSYNIDPDFIFCRAEKPLCEDTKDKIATATCIAASAGSRGVFSVHNVPSVIHVPSVLYHQAAQCRLAELLGCAAPPPPPPPSTTFFTEDSSILKSQDAEPELVVFILGKYLAESRSSDTYLSVCCALEHACAALKVKRWEKVFVNSSQQFEERIRAIVPSQQKRQRQHQQRFGLVIPGGFGVRGVEDKIAAVLSAREYHIPILGICLGLQVITIAAARSVHPQANSTEFDLETPYPIVWKAPGYKGRLRTGGSDVKLVDHLLVENYSRMGALPVKVVRERHRHRYVINNLMFRVYESNDDDNDDAVDDADDGNEKKYNSLLKEVSSKTGLRIAAVSDHCVEAVAWPLPDAPKYYCYGFQYHPEFTSRSPSKPSGAFRSFIKAVIATVPFL